MDDRKFWDRTAGIYDKNVNKTYADSYRTAIDITRELVDKNSTVLDYGCGTGIITTAISGSVKNITAIDISPLMIKKADQKAQELDICNINFFACGLDDQNIKAGKYNVITAFNVLLFFKDIQNVLSQIYDLLPDEGLFLSLTDFLGEKGTFLNSVTKLCSRLKLVPYMKSYTRAELEVTIKQAGFSILKTETLYHTPPNYFIAAVKNSGKAAPR